MGTHQASDSPTQSSSNPTNLPAMPGISHNPQDLSPEQERNRHRLNGVSSQNAAHSGSDARTIDTAAATRVNGHTERPDPAASASLRSQPPGRVPPTAIQLASTLTPIRVLRHQRSISRGPLSHSNNLAHPSPLGAPIANLNARLRSMSISSKQATLKIDVLIVGGGIAGLACAFALGRSGHRVHILEKSDGSQRSGGVRIPPNLTKILVEWGLQDELSKAQKCRKSTFHSLETGEVLGYLEWQEDVIQETGGDFLLMHYDDLYEMLVRLAKSVATKISYNTTVVSVATDAVKDTPSVTLADGTVLESDLVIGADGYKSIVREAVTGQSDEGVDSGHCFYTITIASDKIKNDPDLAKWAEVPEWPIWMADSRSVLGYPVRNGEEYCVHVYWPDNELRVQVEVEEAWDIVVPTDIINFEGYDPIIQRLFTLVPDALRTKYIIRERLEDWVDETGRLVVIGEAAHPLLPCTIHGPSLAVEDATVLGVLMSRLRNKEQIPQFMEAFQDLRQERCNHVHLSELNNAALVTLPPGEHREMRNAGMRLSLHLDQQDWDDGQLREQWEEIGEVFGYNAREAAEDWWLKWGALGDSTRAIPVHEPLGLVYEVTQVEVSA